MGRARYGVRDEIKDTAEAFYRAIAGKNMTLIDDTWVHAPYVAVAGRSGQLQQGWPAVAAYWQKRFVQLGDINVRPKLTDMVCHAVGDVAWLSGIEVRTVQDGDTVTSERLRVTIVLERKPVGWQIVSYHVSAPSEAERHGQSLAQAS